LSEHIFLAINAFSPRYLVINFSSIGVMIII